MVVGIHQPNFLPWLGYFSKIIQSDVFILLDDVQFSKGSVGNRNKVKTDKGTETWMTVPLKHPKTGFASYTEIEIDYSSKWNTKLLAIFHSYYRKAPFYKEVCEILQPVLLNEFPSLAALNIALLETLCIKLQLTTKWVRSSDLKLEIVEKNERILELCKYFGADTYLSGQGAKSYNDEALFNQNGIVIVYQKYKHPCYHQINGPFVSNLSIIDALFNEGFISVSNLLKRKS
jgi:hypothetical protein